ncbi:DUF1501 domain-containing protein [Caulobacter endophyticus]|uniref:DUF1501 domain-containing protein n=1 Tax=Caulobacter endophyticus TaxID=2172652 RepID=A0A2T9K7M0_9CAUL|nr:DUF1501 domain-containing protein [Caulobacter endophyticus]PVM91959.1 hypothetical protein DDF67_05520 [Caulobacter endophyticus]
MTLSRRDFGRLLAGASATAALAQIGVSAAVADTSSYRAMVGIFLFGGNDAWNMVIPNDERYADYAAKRASIAVKQDALMPLTGTAFGLHPAFAPLKGAWDEGALSVVLNAGTLFQPLTKTIYQSRPDLRPLNLMSHEDQQNEWQGMRMREKNLDGFMGRILDKADQAELPPLISIAGSQLALIGSRKSPLILPSTGGISRNGYNAASTDAATVARQSALNAFSDASAFGAVTDFTGRGMSSAYAQAATANTIVSATTSTVDQYFKNPNTGATLTSEISRQLLRAARMIEARNTLGHAKQTFFVSQGGYDTHNGQAASHNSLYADLAMALAGFYAAMKALGLANNVTAFTMSDFGRVYKPNANAGTDHAWGSNHLVLGAALSSRKVHGRYPDTTYGGAEDAYNDGRWIPSIAVEEYIGAIAQWYGVSAADMPYVFPNWATWNGGGRGPVPLFG